MRKTGQRSFTSSSIDGDNLGILSRDSAELNDCPGEADEIDLRDVAYDPPNDLTRVTQTVFLCVIGKISMLN